MPTVPVAQNTVGLAEMTNAKFQPADFGAAGEMVGKSLQGLGQQGSEAASRLFEQQKIVQERFDDATTKQAANSVSAFYSEHGYTGDDPYFQKGGRDAQFARPEFEKGLDTTIQSARSQLKTPRQLRMFDDAVTPQRQQWGVQIATHADKETTSYDISESQSRASLAGEVFRHTAIQDPAHADQQMATALAEVDHLGQLQHWGPDELAAKKLTFTSGAHKDVGTDLVYSDPTAGPTLAVAYVNKHEGEMTTDDHHAVMNNARTYQSTIEAASRRAEADARRENHDQTNDARQRAQSVERMITDGVNVDPKILASAMTDAQFAKDPGLIESLRQGGMKNALTVEYGNTPPAELQNTVNDLGAQIAKAGGNVNADLMVKRDHLTKLLAKSSSDLKADPLSWGSQHLGINPGPLNLADPNSISQRIQAATTVSRRTGALPVPITNEEAASFAPIVTDGTIKQKSELVQHLAAFGSLARSAVEKIAPGDDGFQGLVGLAQLSNPAAARIAVQRVLAGREVLLTNPDIIDKNASLQQFNDMVGPALTFLPTVTNGVYANAQAILASEAGANGKHQWADVVGRWPVAINAALGGYTREGVKVGGLGKINGAVTVLPDGMSQADFDTTISRATGPMFVGASGHQTPLFKDGTVPTATAIKKMIWVPVADGRYRIGDGHGFLEKKGGGFYEVDVRKLH